MLSKGITLVAAGLAAVSGVSAYSPPRAIHSELAKRADGDVQLHKRYSGTRWTFFDVGLGACGKTNVESDFIVALNADQFGSGYPGPNCEKTITMTYNGKTAKAKIMDRCPGCPFGGLDLSRSLFRYFASESVGVISGDWTFDDSSSGSPAPETTSTKIATPVAKPTTSSSKAPAPVATTSTRAAVVTPAAAPARATSSSVRVAQATPDTSSAPRVAPSPSAAAAPASHNASPSLQVAHMAAVSSSATASTPSTRAASRPTAAGSSSSAKASTTSVTSTRASPSSTQASSTGVSSSTAASASASPSPTDPATLMQNNLEAIVAIIARLGDLLAKLRLEKDN